MPMPAAVRDDAVRQVAAFCERRVPVDLRGELRLEHSLRGSRITIVELRPPWSEPAGTDWTSTNVAQLRYDERSGRWTLYAADRNGRWFLYDDVEPSRDVGRLLAEIGSSNHGSAVRSRVGHSRAAATSATNANAAGDGA